MDFLDWQGEPLREDRPGHYVLTLEEPWLHEIQYKFIVDGHWQEDPQAETHRPDGHGGYNSVRAIPDFVEDPWLAPRPQAVPMRATALALTDLEGSARQVTVWSPADGRASMTVYFQDGGDYLERAGAVALLGNLSAVPGFPALTGVFIPPKDRMREYELLPAYADFVNGVVVPAVEARFPATGGDRARRLLLGPSLGGLATLYAALRSPEVFGNAASQSGSLWFGDGAMVAELGAPPARGLRLKLFMDCGTYETPDMLRYNRQGFEAARRAGQAVEYREYPSTHDWIAWRNRLQELLRYFFAPARD
jgi:enterochelin esterase family protein